MVRLLVLIFILNGFSQSLSAQNNVSDDLVRVWFNGSIFTLKNSNDTIGLKNCRITAIKDSIEFIKTESDAFGHFELTVPGIRFFDGGFKIKAKCEGYDTVESSFNWQHYDLMQAASAKWNLNFEMINKKSTK